MHRLSVGLLILFGLVLLAAVALWLARLPLAEWGLARWLEGRGLTGSAEFVHLGRGRAELRGLDLAGQRAGRITVEYDLADLLGAGRVERLEAEGLRLAADLTAERPLGGLLDAFAGTARADGRGALLPVLPPLQLRDAELALTTPRGPLVLRLEGGLTRSEELPEPARRLDLSLETLEGPVRLAGRAQGVYRPGDGDGTALTLALQSMVGPQVAVDAEAAIEAGELALDFRLAGDAPLLSGLATLPPALQPVAGRLALQGEMKAAAAPFLAGQPERLLTDADALHALDLALRLEDASLPGRVQGLDLDGGIVLARPEGERRLELRPLEASAAGLDPDWLGGLGLPAPLAALLPGGGTLDLRAPEGSPPAVLLPGEDPARLQLDLAMLLRPASGGSLAATARGALALPGRFDTLPAGLAGSLRGELAAKSLAMPDLAALRRLEAGYELSLPAAGAGAAGASLALAAPLGLEGLRLPAATVAALPEGWQALAARPLDLILGEEVAVPLLSALPDGRLQVALPGKLLLSAEEAQVDAELGGSVLLSPEGRLLRAEVAVHSLSARALPTPYGVLRSLSLSGGGEGGPAAGQARLRGYAEVERLSLDAAGTADLLAELAAGLSWQGRDLVLELQEPGRLALAVRDGPLAPMAERLELRLAAAKAERRDGAVSAEAVAGLAPVQLDLDGRGAGDDLTLAADRLLLDLALPAEGELHAVLRGEGVAARLADPALALRDAGLTLRFGAAEVAAELASARLVPLAGAPPLPAMTVSGSASLADGAVRYTARGRGMAGALDATASGSYDLERGQGRAQVRAKPLEFSAGGLQPGDLHPALAALGRATGRVAATADLRIGRTLDGTARLSLQDLGFTVAGTRVTGLDLDLALDGLDPPATPPGQPFSIARVDFGPALTDVTGRLQLRPTGTGALLEIEWAEAAFLDGRVALADAVLDPGASRYDLVLQVDRADLQALLALAELEEVTGSGRLSGRIPVSVRDGQVAIDRGALAALEPGIVAFRSEEAREALAQGGESVELMLQALEDFHYRVLDLSVNKPAQGESQVLLKLEGANPAVLEGQPFVLNINLTSNTAPLLAALARGTEISDRLVQQLLQDRLSDSP